MLHGRLVHVALHAREGFISSLHDNALSAYASVRGPCSLTIPGGRERELGGARGLAPESELEATWK